MKQCSAATIHWATAAGRVPGAYTPETLLHPLIMQALFPRIYKLVTAAGVREAGEVMLRYDVQAAACLLPALPPPAQALEVCAAADLPSCILSIFYFFLCFLSSLPLCNWKEELGPALLMRLDLCQCDFL